ncbi:hypothetical protein HPG69_013102 [Diceros bicornis minor]|uniref:Uncharacterized protein n=1 Tax=Diceros bicornis minor TaxID=77932 RepID=A0A7J7F475_DICBM|nr:hypothetical protein HPG69_013102 [Diceros bicornis minor]
MVTSRFGKCHNFSSQKQVVSGLASKPKQDDGGRMAARNRLAAAKKAMRERGQRKEQAEAAASAAPKEVDQIVFDGGFFRIESPVKSFSAVVGNNLTTECHLLDSITIFMFCFIWKPLVLTFSDLLPLTLVPRLAICEAFLSPCLFQTQIITFSEASFEPGLGLEGEQTKGSYSFTLPRLKCSNPSTQVERRQQERARHISFAGDLIAFSP